MRKIIYFSLLSASLFAQSLHVTKGASEYQVYQRGADNAATIAIEGTVAGASGKTIETRLIAAGRTVPNFDWKATGKVSSSGFSARIEHIPAGGPYRLELRVAGSSDVAEVSNLLVGDLWLLAGQSNMEGVGNLVDTPLPSVMVNSLDMTDTWVAAADPLHRMVDAADSVHWRLNAQKQPEKLTGDALQQYLMARKKGAGSGLPFALEMVRRGGVPVGLIPCAHGGTSMDQWDPALKDKAGASLYGGMVRRFQLAGGNIKGVLWYQGEAEASPAKAAVFETKFINLIKAIRTDFNMPQLPFLYVQIGRHASPADGKSWNQVQNIQLKVEPQLPNILMATCADCQLDDQIHVGTDDHRLLGLRLANLADGSTRRGPRPVSAKLSGMTIRVEFAEVNGRLTHEGRLNGFTIVDAQGNAIPTIYRQQISKDNPNIVELFLGLKMPEGAMLQYGYGRDPYVNLRDEAQMGAPVFGPMAIQQ